MSQKPKQPRMDFVESARERVASGFYEHGDPIEVTVNRVLVALKTAQDCPVGEGNAYRDAITELIALNLGNVVDHELIGIESRVPGGRVDAALPLCVENLGQRPLWQYWCREYRVDSIVIEAKNWQKEVGPEAFDQTLRYVTLGKWGRLGMLVSRYGFSQGAIEVLAALVTTRKSLILPLTEAHLEHWSLHCQSPTAKDRFLRQVKNKLVQAAR